MVRGVAFLHVSLCPPGCALMCQKAYLDFSCSFPAMVGSGCRAHTALWQCAHLRSSQQGRDEEVESREVAGVWAGPASAGLSGAHR